VTDTPAETEHALQRYSGGVMMNLIVLMGAMRTDVMVSYVHA
jgi:hypothetical protein